MHVHLGARRQTPRAPLAAAALSLALGGCARHGPPGGGPTPGPPSGHDHRHSHGHAPTGGADLRGPGHGHAMPHRFDDAAAWAARFDAPDRDSWQRPAEVLATLGLQPGMVAADLGAGTGYFLPHLAAAVGTSGRVLALDVEPNLVAHMQARAKAAGLGQVEARLIPFDDPGLAPASVDRIVTINTWHHIGGREAYAAKLKAALKPGGALVVVDYTLESEDGPPKEHRLSPAQIIAELKAGGFDAAVVPEELPRQLIIVAR
ncbi:MAG: hypothetical protein RL071_4171 [Pseudomonadota bacterium]